MRDSDRMQIRYFLAMMTNARPHLLALPVAFLDHANSSVILLVGVGNQLHVH